MKLENKAIIIVFFAMAVSTSPAFAHKLISHDDSHRDFDSALQIPDHRISWAVYENLGAGETKYYTFDAKHGDSFYAGIVVPKIQGLEEYSPTLVLVGEKIFGEDTVPFETQLGTKKVIYNGDYPGREFYEPFGQVTYWERQEIRTDIVLDGQYFIVVTDENNKAGKYSLAIGTIEDFSGGDFFTILPKAWFDTKLFVNDYASIIIAFFILGLIPITPILIRVKKRKGIKRENA